MEEETFTYFFTPRERKYPNGLRADRSTRDGKGYWKITRKNTEISTDNKVHLGKKNTLVYFVETPDGKDHKTTWIMHEFELNEELFPSTSQGKQRFCPNVKYFISIISYCRIAEEEQTLDNGELPLPSPERKFQPNETLTMHHPHDVAMQKSNYLYDSHDLQAAAVLGNMKTKDFGQRSNSSYHLILS
ncbi:hypothetical protein RND71_006186 [Anisodus tanguticus]|uniref:NAC domain-containing protein n=1 Tax=Anisodus tanguticus TaxID=243964 RepID=A0AAE1SRH1_9SOLA|nr:hypothetical protein RND71_006186 [Anisodus tanguticus]